MPLVARRTPARPATELRAEAPSAHMDAILSALDDTDRSLSALMAHGMDGRTASVFRELEAVGAIALHTGEDGVFIDVLDRTRALALLDGMLERA